MNIKRKLFPHKRTKAFFCVIFLALHLSIVPAMAGEKEEDSVPKLNSQSAVLIDGATGRVLYGREEELARPMASTTKIMTCILALENCSPDDEVEVSSYAASQPKVHLGAPAGRRFRLKDILYSLMLESHNDSAVMVAEHVAGSTGEFAAMMNKKAREIGCEDTWFITPNGLDAREKAEDGTVKVHSTTARDLASIMRYCTWESPRSQEFLDITRTQNYYFTGLDGKGSYSCVNHNALLTMMDGALSGKTGFTGGAGYCYVGAVEDGDRGYVIALLGCGWPPHKTYKWNDARKLFQYGLENYENRALKEAGEQEFNPVPVLDGIPCNGRIGHDSAVRVRTAAKGREEVPKVLMREGEQVTVSLSVPESLQAPVREGQQVGEINYSLEGVQVWSEPVYAAKSVGRIDFGWCVRQTLTQFLQESPNST